MRQITTTGLGSFSNDFDTKAQSIITLINTYILNIPTVKYGFHQLGAEDVSFPAIFVEPSNYAAKMGGTGKFLVNYTFDIYFYCVDNNPDDLTTQITSLAEALAKIFSNNALGDLGSGNTGKFKLNPGVWDNVEMKLIQITPAFQFALPAGGTLMRAGRFRLETENFVIK